MKHEWWSVAVQIMKDESGKKPGGTGSGGGSVSRWWRLQEKYRNPPLLFCDTCIEPRLWSRQVCQECGTHLHTMTNEDASRVWVKNLIAMVVQGILAPREKIKIG